jgi:PAS domain S-box-containing protein
VISASTPTSEPHSTREVAQQFHDLRTPLNQIIGLSEMLIEIAEDAAHSDFVEGLGAVRQAGLELAALLQDERLIAGPAEPATDYMALSDAVRAAISRVLGFAELVLSEPPAPRQVAYRDDLALIRKAAGRFVELARSSGLLLRVQTAGSSEFPLPPDLLEPDTAAAGGRVLIVDDESLNREVLSRRLKREGYRPTCASSGPEALQILRQEQLDAILLDIQMPGMSGIEVLQTLKLDPKLRHLPVIMLSALTDVERVARCVELGAEDYLPKPINSVLLRARLGACLEKKQLRDQDQAHFQALHDEKERLSVTLRSLADAVVTTDPDGKIVLLNDVASTLTGISSEAARGRAFEEVFPILNRASGEPAPNPAMVAIAQNSVAETESGLMLKSSDEQERLVAVRSAPVRGLHGGVQGAVVVVRDITEKEKITEEVLRASKLQSIGVLAGGLAHDFNNMLTAVLGNLSLIRHRQELAPELMLSIHEAERGALRAQELTRYLLTFSDGGAPIKKVLQPGALIEETSSLIARGAVIQCDVNIAPDLWETEADANQLAQAISNIVMNAVEATAAGGKISVRAHNVHVTTRVNQLAPGDYVCVVVQDSGVGISAENLPRIFDPFFTTKKQARGLGLAAAYSIIQRHGAHVAVESLLGVGSTVTVHLLAVPPGASSAKKKADTAVVKSVVGAPIAPGTTRRKVRVLIMDDEEAIRLLGETILGMLDYEVVATADGEAALAAHAEAVATGQPFDVAIMDLTIPGGMGGKETISRLRQKDTAIRTIVSSGYSNDPVMAYHTDHGFDGVLPKPYVVDDLIRIVEEFSPAG